MRLMPDGSLFPQQDEKSLVVEPAALVSEIAQTDAQLETR